MSESVEARMFAPTSWGTPRTMADIDRRSVVAGAIGNMLEWYDFAVFGFVASAISSQFFPSDDRLAGLLNTFAVFAVGYLARPLGGALFGHLGDRIGRKRALQISIVMMAVPTSLIAVLPTHAEIGVWAAVLLVLLRLAQGFSVGGEFIGSICYLVEVAPINKRGLFGSYAVFSTVGGMLLGSAVAAGLNLALSPEAIAAWGWRLPFLGGVVLGFAGWKLRRQLLETPAFDDIVRQGRTSPHPVLRAMRQMPVEVAQVGIMVTLLGVGIYTLFIWMPTYLTHIVAPPVPHALIVNTLAMALMIALMPVAGRLTDRIGYKPVLVGAMIATAIVVYPLFVWIDTGGVMAMIVAMTVFAVVNGFLQGPTPVAMAAQFPVEIRCSAMAAGYNVSMAVFGGTAPLIATWLIGRTGNLAAPAWYVAVIAAISAAATLTLKGQYQLNDPSSGK
jgi:MFS transporter, MHS family, proline/betaine transporter